MKFVSNLISSFKRRSERSNLHSKTTINTGMQDDLNSQLYIRDMDDNYILPNLFVSNTFQDLENIKQREILLPIGTKPPKYKSISFSDLVDKKMQTFIIGEPGCGKSRLLYEIRKNAEKLNKKYLLISLKDLDENESIINQFNIDIDEGVDKFIICLDALDEVNSYLFSKVVYKILDLKNLMIGSTILVSCRMHYISENQYLLNSLKFDFTLLTPFTEDQIRVYLTNNVIGNVDLVNKILNTTKDNFGQSILAIPRYLKEICKYLQVENISKEEIGKLKRHNFLELAIYSKMDNEISNSKNKNENEKYIVKRVLEKLALTMEIYQTNQLKIDELITFFDNIDSNLNLIFLKTIDIDNFIERQLKKTDNIVEFDNTEFQEYLAAKELLRLGSKSQILYELILHKEQEHIFQNWYDVLRFVVEIDASQILPIVNLLNQKKGGLVIDDYFRLLDYVDFNQFNTKEKAFVFNSIFEYHQRNNLWIHYNIHRIVDLYQDASYELYFDKIIVLKEHNVSQLVNQIYTVENLIHIKKLTENQIEYWKNVLTKLLIDSDNSTVQSACIHTLTSMQDVAIFMSIKEELFSKSKELQNSYYSAISIIAPDSEFTFNELLEGLKNSNREAIVCLNQIVEKNKLLDIVKVLNERDTEYANFFNYNHNHLRTNQVFIYNIGSVIDSLDDVDCINLFILFIKILKDEKNFFGYENNEFVEELYRILYQKDNHLISKLVDVLPEKVFDHLLIDAICKYIKPDDIKILSNKLTSVYGNNRVLLYIFRRIQSSNNIEKDVIYNLRLKYFEKEFSKPDIIVNDEDDKRELKIYQRFEFELEPEPNLFYLRVFETYLNNRSIIEKLIDDKTKEKLTNLIVYIIKNHNPIDVPIKVTEQSESERQISMGQFIMLFPKILKIAYLNNLKEKLLPYRRNIINYIPIMFDDSSDNTINEDELFYLIDDLTDDDIHNLLVICNSNVDDYLYVSTSQFIRLIKAKEYKKLIPIVKNLSKDSKLRPYEKIEALNCLSELFADVDCSFFKDYFLLQPEDTKENWNIKSKLSEILIVKFKDIDAIQWRFNHLNNKTIKYVEPEKEGARYVSETEVELEFPTFANCLIETGEISLIPNFLDLLKRSFEIRRNISYIKYSDYLQIIVFNFFKYLNKTVYLNQLKDYVKKYANSSITESFKRHIRNLEINIVESSKPLNINTCINRYNELTKSILLPIYDNIDLRYYFEVIIQELKNVIENEGLYKTIQDLAIIPTKDKDKVMYTNLNEDIIQKTIKVQIENLLFKKGFRGSDIFREVELYDGKRPDFLIKYGFVGPIMVEVKLLHNTEITNDNNRIEYKEKLKQYINATNSQYSFYLIFKVRTGKSYDKYELIIDRMKEEYSDISNLGIYLIDCTY